MLLSHRLQEAARLSQSLQGPMGKIIATMCEFSCVHYIIFLPSFRMGIITHTDGEKKSWLRKINSFAQGQSADKWGVGVRQDFGLIFYQSESTSVVFLP